VLPTCGLALRLGRVTRTDEARLARRPRKQGCSTCLFRVLAQQRYAKSHRILANCRGVKDFRRFRNSQDGTWFSRRILGAYSTRTSPSIPHQMITYLTSWSLSDAQIQLISGHESKKSQRSTNTCHSNRSIRLPGCGPECGDLKRFLRDFTHLCWANPYF
jgi:hypothetical protein